MSDATPEFDHMIGAVVLGRYRIVRELARGGMGAIYLARSEGAASFVKPVVVKRMLPEFVGDADAARMFKREARIMSQLRHPGIVSVFDFEREDSGYLLVMDYVHGFHFGRWASWLEKRGRRVPVGPAVHIVLQVLEALSYAHTLKTNDGEPLRIVHRDVSPSNVLLDVSGHVRLADFGIAQSRADEPDVKTTTRSVKGKFSYLAPDILEGADPTPTSDVYSCAVVLHEVLTGRNEFRAPTPTATVTRALTHVPSRLDLVRQDVPKALADVVAYALNKRPSDRFQTANELARSLRAVRGMAAEEASALLADTFGRDFRDPSLPAQFHLPPLSDLERAWQDPSLPRRVSSYPPTELPETYRPRRNTGEGAVVGGGQLHPGDQIATVTERASPQQNTEPTEVIRTSQLGLFAVAGAIAAVAMAILAVMFLIPRDEPEFVYLEASPDGISSADSSAQRLVTDAGLVVAREPDAGADIEEGDPSASRRQPRSPEREARAIQRAFDRRVHDMVRCFRTDTTADELVLRFSLLESGTITSVGLTPGEVAQSAEGRCVLGVARSIQFPRVSSPRTFRVPVQVRRR